MQAKGSSADTDKNSSFPLYLFDLAALECDVLELTHSGG